MPGGDLIPGYLRSVAAQAGEMAKQCLANLAPVDFTRVAADVARTLLPDIEEKRIHWRTTIMQDAVEQQRAA